MGSPRICSECMFFISACHPAVHLLVLCHSPLAAPAACKINMLSVLYCGCESFMALRSSLKHHSFRGLAFRASTALVRRHRCSIIPASQEEEHVIVGAGLAGVATAYLLLVRTTTTMPTSPITKRHPRLAAACASMQVQHNTERSG